MFSLFSALNRGLGTLFRPLREVSRIGRMLNPRLLFNRLGLGRIKGRFSSISRMIRSPLRSVHLPREVQQLIDRFRPDSAGAKRGKKTSDSRRGLLARGRRGKAEGGVGQAAISQIHLVDQVTGERTVVHVGSQVGQSYNDVILNPMSHPPVRLRFAEVNPRFFGAPFLMTYVAGESKIEANGREVTDGTPVSHLSQIVIDGYGYSCELYAWDPSPGEMRVEASWLTSTGPVRGNNEDAIGIYQHRDAYCFVIADGVGGGYAGELISEFATRYMLAAFHKNVKYNLRWVDVFAKAVGNINAEVRRFAHASDLASGTTLTAVVVQGWEAHVVHVGDSRLYRTHAGILQQVTVDHATTEVAPSHDDDDEASGALPQTRNVLLKAIGKNDLIAPDFMTLHLQPGDKMLLCTDGATDEVEEREIAGLMMSISPAKLPDAMIALANKHYNTDNASVVSINVLESSGEADGWRARSDNRVYVGYDPQWRLELEMPKELVTQHPLVSRPLRFLLVVLILIAVVFAGTRLLTGNNSGTVVPDGANAATVIVTPSSTATTFPTATARRTPTPMPTVQPTASPIPPTSTLRALAMNPVQSLRPACQRVCVSVFDLDQVSLG